MENRKILVVDDDPMTCTLLETVLEMENFQTGSANTVADEDVVALLETEKPDMLILDFHMGSKETVEYVAMIRSDPNWQDLPVLMTSAIDRQQESLAAGADGFILKPFNWQQITKVVNEILQG